MNKRLYVIFFIFILTVSCKKKATEQEPEKPEVQKIDTLKPSSYLPVFPGSYWKYLTSKGDTITYTTSASYEKDSYQDHDDNGTVTKSAIAYVPKYNGVFIWQGYGHNGPIINYGNTVTNSLIAIVPESFDTSATWIIYLVGHSLDYCKILKKDTSIEISGKSYSPTIVIGTYGQYSGGPKYLLSKEYYTKDIGLVKHEELFTSNSEYHLVDYHINK